MDLIERAFWMIFGGFVGFILGYIVANLRVIKEEVDDIDQRLKDGLPDRDDAGAVNKVFIDRAFYVLVLVIVVFGAFSAQKASNDVRESTGCSQDFLSGTIKALNERTTYSSEQARANVELQKAQSEFLAILLENPPPTDERVRENLEKYFDNLSDYVEINSKTREKVENNPYPTVEEYNKCLSDM